MIHFHELDKVMYYAEISKASLECWSSDICSDESRGLFSRIKKRIPNKVRCAAISAGAGAVV